MDIDTVSAAESVDGENKLTEHPSQEAAQTTPWDDFERTGKASGAFKWPIADIWKALGPGGSKGSITSKEFEIAGYSWTLMLQFTPLSAHDGKTMGLFLVCEEACVLPAMMQPRAKFTLALINSIDETDHKFSPLERDWGFKDFVPLKQLTDARSTAGEDGLAINVEVTVSLEERFCADSREETGYVGLKNQGATCYLNSWLQSFFHVPQFRRAVYHMPTEEGEDPYSSLSAALKNLFFRLQYSPTPVSAKELISAFGWQTADALQQHDVQELELIIFDRLEQRMKGTIVDGTVEELLKGKMRFVMKCVNVPFESKKEEPFMDIQLPVSGCRDLYDSFDKLIEKEVLDGENKYDAEKFGKQDACRFQCIAKLPPVLQLHLMRFHFNYSTGTSFKINSRYEFYDEIDLSQPDRQYIAADSETATDQKYKLLSVLVHAGANQGGHYNVYIRPDGKTWYKFDDEKVTKVDQSEAIEGQYGENAPVGGGGMFGRAAPRPKPLNNAYMLVYIRLSDWDHIMRDTGKEELEPHVRAALEAQLNEKDAKRRRKMQAHRFVSFQVLTLKDMQAHVEKSAFHLIDPESFPAEGGFKINKTRPWQDVIERVAEISGVPTQYQTWWIFHRNSDRTYRPYLGMQPQSIADKPIKHEHRQLIRDKVLADTMETVCFYVTHSQVPPQRSPLYIDNSLKLLLLKRVNPHEQRVTLATPELVESDKLRDVLCSQGGSVEPFILVEEATDPDLRLRRLRDTHLQMLNTGSILILQDQSQEGNPASEPASPHHMDTESENGLDSDIEAFLKSLHNRRRVLFSPLPTGRPTAVLSTTSQTPLAASNKRQGAHIDNVPGTEPAASTPAPAPAACPAQNMSAVAAATTPPAPPAQRVCIELAKDSTYDDVVQLLGHRIHQDPAYLRLTTRNSYTCLPSRRPIASGVDFVAEYCAAYSKVHDVFYEVLDMPLKELEQLQTMRVLLVKPNLEVVRSLNVRLPKDALVRELLAKVAEAAPAGLAKVRLRALKLFKCQIYEALPESAPIKDLNSSYWNIRVEPIPKDDLEVEARCQAASSAAVAAREHRRAFEEVENGAANGQDSAREDGEDEAVGGMLQVCASHSAFIEGTSQTEDFGEPVLVWMEPHESVGDLQRRIQTRFKIPDEEFAKWKWGIRASVHSPMQSLDDPTELVATELEAMRGKVSAPSNMSNPTICMVHENKIPGGRRTAGTYSSYEAQIRMQ